MPDLPDFTTQDAATYKAAIDEWMSYLSTVTNKTWITPREIGPATSFTLGSSIWVTALTETRVAVIAFDDADLRMYKLTGAGWVQEGNALSLGVTGNFSISALNSTDIALVHGTGIDELRTYRFNSPDWGQIGNSLAIPVGASITALNATDIVMNTSANDDLQTYRFNGTNWSTLGNALDLTLSGGAAMTALNGTDIAFIDANINAIRTYRFDSTNWSQVGNSLSISTLDPKLSAITSNTVAHYDNSSKELSLYTFDDTNWSQACVPLELPNSNIGSLTSLNGTDIIFIDNLADEFRTYRFGFYLGDGPSQP